MLHQAKTLKGYKLRGRDGEIGKVQEFYFDDHGWTIRYLVADTGNWLTGRQVLLSPHALGTVNSGEQYIAVNLTKRQIEDSPPLSSDKPVSRQFEEAYHDYYGWPMYGVQNIWGPYPYVARDRLRDSEQRRESAKEKRAWDHHLRSTQDVSGHYVCATDGLIGHVEDFIVDDDTWVIRYLIIDTRNWWPGKKVLVSPRWIERFSWSESKVFVNLLRENIKQSPEYHDESLVTREYETGLHRHYKREGYWADELANERSR
jgi:hypothetical protein